MPTGADAQFLKSLAPNEWLSDEIINSMLVLLPPVDDILILDSFFYVWVARKEWGRLPKHNTLVRNGPKLLVNLYLLYCVDNSHVPPQF